ncbi:MAG: magnesium transporter CorA family protein [Candidatus Sungbacteria bacterium]|nr:magnesium transporter CorA family protein [Candidatus Sungbacteria bacterium]
MATITHNRISWVNLRSPSARDVESLKKDYEIHESPLADIVVEAATPKIEQFDTQLYLVLHFPVFNPERRTTEGREINFIITKDAVITVYRDNLLPLEQLFETCEASEETREELFSDTTAHLLFNILSQLYDYSVRQLNHIKKNIDVIDTEMFRDSKVGLVKNILEVRRDILNFRRTLAPQRHILESLIHRGAHLLGRRSAQSFEDLKEAYNRVWQILESHKDAIEAIHETNDSLLASQQNGTIQTLTMLSVVTFYLSLVAAIFSTDAVYKPIIGSRYDFWIIVAIMAGMLVILLLFFRRKHWL